MGHYFAIYFDNTDYGDDSISSLRLEVDMYKTIYQADLENNTSILTVCNKEIEVPYLLPLDFPDLIQFNYEIKKMIAFLWIVLSVTNNSNIQIRILKIMIAEIICPSPQPIIKT